VTPTRCDREWEREAHREGRLGPKDVESFERHCRTCAACTEEVARDERLRALGQALRVAEPGQLPRRRLRARILRDAATDVRSRSSRSWRSWQSWQSWQRVAFASSFGILLVALASGVAVRSAARTQVASANVAPSPAPLAGAVSPGAAAVWTQAREGGVERVELETGTLRVHVRPQGPGERFFVRLPDGEIEVRGTTFDVTVLDGATRHISVDEGTVVLRLHGSPDRSLGSGTNWIAPESRTPDVHETTAVHAAAVSPRQHPRDMRDMRDGDDGVSAYVNAMQSFREGRYDAAAAAFHAFALAFPRATEAEDASFLEALSLARAGRTDAAALAAERHLESFPRSFRRKEASILVARAAYHRGRCDEALRALAPWMSASPDPEIQSVLVECSGGADAR
jgi:FecR protein